MKIRELSIKNCLSFSNKGFNPDDSIALGDFNLFIGKNNSGKSNVLRLVRLIQDILLSILAADYDMVDFALEFKPDRSLFKDWFYAQDVDNNIHFSFLIAIEEEDQNILQIQPYVHGNQDPLLFLLEQRNGFPKDVKISGLIKYKDGPLVTITKVEIPNDHSYYSIEPILFDSESRKMLVLREGNLSRLVWKLELIRDDGEWKQGHI
jgi:hypothetical protein